MVCQKRKDLISGCSLLACLPPGIHQDPNFGCWFCSSEISKDHMVVDLAFRTKVLLWSGIVLGSLSVGVIAYAFVRYFQLVTVFFMPPFTY